MTITVLPMDATAGAPTYTAQHARQAQAPLYGNPTGRVFGTRSGWRVGTLSSIVSVTSTTWTLNPCACMIEPAASLYQGAYGWASDAVITGPVTAADGTNPRIDILYIQVNDSSAGDGSGGLSAPVSYLAGTPAPAGTQVAPTLPPRSFLVATIAVPKLAAGSPTVTFNATYFIAAGGKLPINTQAERDALTPYVSEEVSRLDKPIGYTEVWTGTKWAPPPGPLGLLWYAFDVANSAAINVSEVVTKSSGSFSFKGGRRYRIGWQSEYYMDTAGMSFQIKSTTAAVGDSASATTGLTNVCYHTIESTPSSTQTQFFYLAGIYDPPADITVQVKFSVIKVGGPAGSVFLNGNTGRRIEYFIEDLGAQF